jgi:hypothetical protein
MIRRLKIWWFSRKLERLIAKRLAELERNQFAKRSAASRLGWARRRAA